MIKLTVAAEDVYNNTATGYAGTVSFSSTDKNASTVLPANKTLSLGLGTFTATLTTSGGQTITAADKTTATISGVSGTITVSPLAATHFAISAQTATTAGTNMLFTVSAEDQYNNLAPTYTGTVSFSSSDTSASSTLPAPNTLALGLGTFNATLTTAGNQTIMGTDSVNSLTGTSNTFLVNGATATHFVFSNASNATAGAGLFYTIAAEDKYNNTANLYTGTVSFSSSDPGPLTKLQANTKLTSGLGTFQATLTTVGTQTLTANDVTFGTISGHTGGISVVAGGANHLVVKIPSTATASVSFSMTIIAEDAFNNTATTYLGTVDFTTTDQNNLVQLPAPFTFISADNGVATFTGGVTLYTSNNQVITAQDANTSSIVGISTVTVSPSNASHFTVSTVSSTTAGNLILITVTAKDNYNNVVPAYNGTVTLSSGDTQATFGPASTLASGLGTFSGTLITAGNQSVTASDTGGHQGLSNQITVNAAAATHFVVSSPANATAGVGFSYTVVAEDKFNNTAAGYTGTVTFSSTDTGAATILPLKSPLVAGAGTFTATLTTSGNQMLTAVDQVASTLSGVSGAINAGAAATTHFAVSAPGAATAGTSINVTVVAEDQYNNQATSYTGTVLFLSSDSLATVPPHSTLSSGAGTFGATLAIVGSQTLTAVDAGNNSLTGASNAITVSAGQATHFVVSAPAAATAGTFIAFTVKAEDLYNNLATTYAGSATFSSSDKGASTKLPANSTLASGVGTFRPP